MRPLKLVTGRISRSQCNEIKEGFEKFAAEGLSPRPEGYFVPAR